jgi:high-affinity nickel permease
MFPALIAALLLGLRHGSDIDHVAAISDLSATEGGGTRAFRLSTVYALGRAAVLLAFGVAAVSFGLVIPKAVDGLMGRVIGFTLIALAIYVVVGFLRFGRTWQPRSRGIGLHKHAHEKR